MKTTLVIYLPDGGVRRLPIDGVYNKFEVNGRDLIVWRENPTTRDIEWRSTYTDIPFVVNEKAK